MRDRTATRVSVVPVRRFFWRIWSCSTATTNFRGTGPRMTGLRAEGIHKDHRPRSLAKIEETVAALTQQGTSGNGPLPASVIRHRQLAFGYGFLEKFIQIPYPVPQATRSALSQFVQDFPRGQPAPGFFKRAMPHLPHWLRSLVTAAPSGALPGPVDAGNAQEQKKEKTSEKNKEQECRRQAYLSIDREDSENVLRIVDMVCPALDSNPRRLKQFRNLFRLRAYTGVATGLLDDRDGQPSMTFEQLGKFVALTLRWPDFLADLSDRHGLLDRLDQIATSKTDAPQHKPADGIEEFWCNNRTVMDLLGFVPKGTSDSDVQRYRMGSVDVERLLTAQPLVPRQPSPPGNGGSPPPGTPGVAGDGVPTSAPPPPGIAAGRVAAAATGVATAAPEDTLLEALRSLAREYQETRRTMPASSTRTEQMAGLINPAADLAKNVSDVGPLARQLFETGDDGGRVLALTLLLRRPLPENTFDLIVQAIRNPKSQFEQYRALMAADVATRQLGPADRAPLKEAIDVQRSGVEGTIINSRDRSRWDLSAKILHSISGLDDPSDLVPNRNRAYK